MITLNQRQQAFVDLAVDWFWNSPSKLLQLAGYAGTGKSIVISEVIKRLNLRTSEILPMAYTGQACTIMRKKGLPNACTCHSGLFNAVQEVETNELGFPKMNSSFNTPVLKWKFIPKDLANENIKLIILDEAWMIPKSFKKFIDETGIKVLAAGDPGQLPPIGEEPGYLVSGDIFMLTELMRQSETSPIIYLANRARGGFPIEPGLYGNDVLVIFDDELDNNIISRANIVLSPTNKTREEINCKVRNEILQVKEDFPIFGERLICRKNNWELSVDKIPLVNGLVGTVIKPPEIGTFVNGTMRIDFLPDLLNKPFTNLKISHTYLNASHKEREEWKRHPYYTQYMQGERFEYAYASTVHLSQGSEYSAGVYIEEYLDKSIQNALNYTGITRFKDKLIYVKPRPKTWGINYGFNT